ncbi:grpE [Symbiodinium sp. KB8]|nr:grpE [Symbiodinium sp. KB8]
MLDASGPPTTERPARFPMVGHVEAGAYCHAHSHEKHPQYVDLDGGVTSTDGLRRDSCQTNTAWTFGEAAAVVEADQGVPLPYLRLLPTLYHFHSAHLKDERRFRIQRGVKQGLLLLHIHLVMIWFSYAYEEALRLPGMLDSLSFAAARSLLLQPRLSDDMVKATAGLRKGSEFLFNIDSGKAWDQFQELFKTPAVLAKYDKDFEYWVAEATDANNDLVRAKELLQQALQDQAPQIEQDQTEIDQEQFPEYEELEEEYVQFVFRISPVPLLFLLLGVVVSITTCACLCCGGSGYHFSMDFSDMTHDETKGFVSGSTGNAVIGDEEFARRAWKKRPSCFPMFCAALLIILLCFFGGLTRIVNAAWTEYIIVSSLDRAMDNAVDIANASLTINETVTNLHDKLLEVALFLVIPRAAKQVLYTFVHSALGAIDDYVEQVYFIVETVQPIPDQIGKFKNLTHRAKPFFASLPLAPLWLVAFICIGIVVEATCTTCCRSSSLARCVDVGLKLSALLFGLIVFVVAVLVCVETVVLIALSKFCEDVDHNVLSYVNSTTYNISYIIPEIANYYIRGGDRNPIDEYDTLAMKYINQIQDYYNQAAIGVAGLGLACPAFFDLDVNAIATKARGILGKARELLKGENIYPYYRKVVRAGICNVVISGVGWMWLLQVVVGMVLFPTCAILTHRFLVSWAAWQKVKEARRAKKVDPQPCHLVSDDSSDSDDGSVVSDMTSGTERSLDGAPGADPPRWLMSKVRCRWEVERLTCAGIEGHPLMGFFCCRCRRSRRLIVPAPSQEALTKLCDSPSAGACVSSTSTAPTDKDSVAGSDSSRHQEEPQFVPTRSVTETSAGSAGPAGGSVLGLGLAMTLLAGLSRSPHPRQARQVLALRAEAEAKEEAEEPAEAEAEAQDETEDEEEAEADEEEQKPSKWKCLDCGSMNFAASTECDKCGAAKPSAEEAQMIEERDKAKDEVAKVMDGFLRMQADLQNYRRSHDEAMARAKDLGKVDALQKLLPITDDIEAAVAEPEGMDAKDKAIFDSYSLLFRKIGDVWTKFGVDTLTVAAGDMYDEDAHEVVEEREPTDGQASGTVIEVVKPGFSCDGKVVISPQVIIASSSSAEAEEAPEEAEAAA